MNSTSRILLKKIQEFHDRCWMEWLEQGVQTAVNRYHPLPGQRRFHEAGSQLRLLFGGNRSGKTVAGAAEAVWHALGEYPDWYPSHGRSPVPSKGWIVGLDYVMMRDVIEPALLHFLAESWIASWNRYSHVIQLVNGSTIGLKSVDSGRRKFQGTSRHWIWLDEECPEEIYRECRARIVDVGGRLWMTLTPLQGYSYLRNLVAEVESNDRMTLVYASTRDNAVSVGGSIPDEEIDSFAGQLSPSEALCRLEGKFQPVEGRVYPSFDRTLHLDSSLHYEPARELLWSWDFNVTPLCTVLGQVDGECLLIVDEIVLSGPHGHTTEEAVQEFLKRYPIDAAQPRDSTCKKRFGVSPEIGLYGDYAGMARDHRGYANDYEIIRRALERAGRPRPRLHVRPNPSVRERVQAVERLLNPFSGPPRLRIAPHCRFLIEDLEQVCWDRNGNLDKRTDPRRTHAGDALGYLVAERFPLTPFNRQGLWVPPW